jgi:hypothetical protein
MTPNDLRPIRVTVELANGFTEVVNIPQDGNGTRNYGWDSYPLRFAIDRGAYIERHTRRLIITWEEVKQ